ncbi:hypothetical protein A6764_01235 [Brevibacillus sp. WF146]|uniref:hypothetical protein n=1 Tax=Brevibacillus sp. WF146 TaxID=319501 RepID=UPI0007ECC2B4|nr:hypothetical protein [Brevibacillus sp. WF146]UYZ13646.1 hypothetical protein A6764_01235 [Brevibacillus sp. WF146]
MVSVFGVTKGAKGKSTERNDKQIAVLTAKAQEIKGEMKRVNVELRRIQERLRYYAEQQQRIAERARFEKQIREKLGRPRVEVKEVTNSGDEAQVLAAFEIIDYDHHNQIRAIYAGNLVFTLRNVFFLAWEIQGVEVKRKMEAQ